MIAAETASGVLLAGYGGGALGALMATSGRAARLLAATGAALGSLGGLVLAGSVLASQTPTAAALPQLLAVAGGISVRLDLLGAFFLAIVSIVGLPAAVYGAAYTVEYEPRYSVRFVGALLNLFLLGMCLVTAAANMLTFILGWEVMSVASYLLVMTDSDEAETRHAGLWYIAHDPFRAAPAAADVLPDGAGGRRFGVRGPCRRRGRSRAGGPQRRVHPRRSRLRVEGRPRAPSCLVAARASRGAQPRVGADVGGDDHAGHLRTAARDARPARRRARVVGRAAARDRFRIRTARGVLRADRARPETAACVLHRRERRHHHHRRRRRPAASQLWAEPGSHRRDRGAALFHALNHACFKGLLFLAAGNVLHQAHTRDMEQMGGLIKRMPQTALLFALRIRCHRRRCRR